MNFSNIALSWIQWIVLMKTLLGRLINIMGEHCEYPKKILDCSGFVYPDIVVFGYYIHIAFGKDDVMP